ncbi:DUF6455 family protein [Tateyamaria pelophila]|uniref:DUF6455 family protein n=1 Tax=Tateyamaria pelophila TaxID=328415 RepID=UPI001CBBB0C3|nr:DUF6455 family protein [Tateyamaria pelophila]
MSLSSKRTLSADLVNGVITRMRRAAPGPAQSPGPVHARGLREVVKRCADCSDQSGRAALQTTRMRSDKPPIFCPNTNALMALPKV